MNQFPIEKPAIKKKKGVGKGTNQTPRSERIRGDETLKEILKRDQRLQEQAEKEAFLKNKVSVEEKQSAEFNKQRESEDTQEKKESIRKRILFIYEKYVSEDIRQEKLASLPNVFQKYDGREESLLQVVLEKYQLQNVKLEESKTDLEAYLAQRLKETEPPSILDQFEEMKENNKTVETSECSDQVEYDENAVDTLQFDSSSYEYETDQSSEKFDLDDLLVPEEEEEFENIEASSPEEVEVKDEEREEEDEEEEIDGVKEEGEEVLLHAEEEENEDLEEEKLEEKILEEEVMKKDESDDYTYGSEYESEDCFEIDTGDRAEVEKPLYAYSDLEEEIEIEEEVIEEPEEVEQRNYNSSESSSEYSESSESSESVLKHAAVTSFQKPEQEEIDLYKALNLVSVPTSDDKVRAAFLARVRDLERGEEFDHCCLAYRALVDPELRRIYSESGFAACLQADSYSENPVFEMPSDEIYDEFFSDRNREFLLTAGLEDSRKRPRSDLESELENLKKARHSIDETEAEVRKHLKQKNAEAACEALVEQNAKLTRSLDVVERSLRILAERFEETQYTKAVRSLYGV